MKFLKLRDGLLLINPALIASVEKSADSLFVNMSDGGHYSLTGADVRTVLDAVDPKWGNVAATEPVIIEKVNKPALPTPAGKGKNRLLPERVTI